MRSKHSVGGSSPSGRTSHIFELVANINSKSIFTELSRPYICKCLIPEFLISSAAADPPKHSEGGNQIPMSNAKMPNL